MKKMIIAGLVAIVFIGTFVFLWIKAQPQPKVYDEFTPTVADLRKTTVLTGKIEPRNEVNIKPQISGIITELMKEVGQVNVGMPMTITVGALQDLKFNARLEYISPKAVEANGANQCEIKAAVQVPEKMGVRSGYSANAQIVLAEALHVLTVPESAIHFEGNNTYVYLVQGKGKNKTYQRRDVKVGLSDGVNIQIKSGLTTNDRVRGLERVEENDD